VESGTNLAGLLQHLTFVESLWFEAIVAGGTARRGRNPLGTRETPTSSASRSTAGRAVEIGLWTAVGRGERPRR
jgi:hypothetical protein